MTNDQLDILQQYEDGDIDLLFTKAIEEEAARLEVTVDYFMYEFL